MRRFLILAACFAALLVAASPVTANEVPTTGQRINLLAPPATFAAGTPFYIEHGNGCDTTNGDKVSDCMNASTHFDLYLDGVRQRSIVDVENSPTLKVKFNLTNYPAGLAPGTHTFCGYWFSNGSQYVDTCATINFQ
jgi:hypothetical protein